MVARHKIWYEVTKCAGVPGKWNDVIEMINISEEKFIQIKQEKYGKQKQRESLRHMLGIHKLDHLVPRAEFKEACVDELKTNSEVRITELFRKLEKANMKFSYRTFRRRINELVKSNVVQVERCYVTPKGISSVVRLIKNGVSNQE